MVAPVAAAMVIDLIAVVKKSKVIFIELGSKSMIQFEKVADPIPNLARFARKVHLCATGHCSLHSASQTEG